MNKIEKIIEDFPIIRQIHINDVVNVVIGESSLFYGIVNSISLRGIQVLIGKEQFFVKWQNVLSKINA